jgi:hypothetical protein
MGSRAPNDSPENVVIMANASRREQSHLRWKLARRFLVGFLALVVLVILLGSMNYRDESIDVNTGQVRYRRMVGPIVYSSHIVHTPFTRLAASIGIRAESQAPAWKLVSSQSYFFPISPHTRYHEIPTTLHEYTILCELKQINVSKRREQILLLLDSLHSGTPEDIEAIVNQLRK